ncbi:hypothetical protein, partial [Amycolatopsis thailandensis]|uniref:hypothetical protein n=1 Tax=Amycolatopsis thailandensis TaxID=589330 RepID=UPI00363D212E
HSNRHAVHRVTGGRVAWNDATAVIPSSRSGPVREPPCTNRIATVSIVDNRSRAWATTVVSSPISGDDTLSSRRPGIGSGHRVRLGRTTITGHSA